MTAPAWRPGLRWLPLGFSLGIASGVLCGAALVVVSALFPGGPSSSGPSLAGLGLVLVLGALFGGVVGGCVGIVVGLPFVLLVGPHLPRRTARARAFVLGAVLPPLVLATVIGAASHEGLSATLLLTPPVLGSAVLGGPLAAWAAGLEVALPSTPPPAAPDRVRHR